MDTFPKASNSSAHKTQNINDDHEKWKSNKIEKKPITFISRIPIKNNYKFKRSLPCKSIKQVLRIEIPNSEIEIVIEPFEKQPILAMTTELIANENRIREEVTAQDIFRLRVPTPKTDLQRVCSKCAFYPIHGSRFQMPLLILDLDTLRLIYPAIVPWNKPNILNLLELVYNHFDIAIWSSNKMCDLITKLEGLELFKQKNKFQIVFALDRTSMTPAYTTDYRMTKDIEVIWYLYPQYNEHNSIMVNHNLKEVIYEIYQIPPKNRKQNQPVDEIALKVVTDFLTETICSSQSLLKLNTLVWKQYEKKNL